MFKPLIATLLLASTTAAAQTVLPPTIAVPYPPYEENLYAVNSHVYREPGTSRVLRIAFSTQGADDTRDGALTYKLWYQVSSNNGVTYDQLRPLIQKGSQYNQVQPIRGVDVLKNSFMHSFPPPSRASNGEIMVPMYVWPLDENGDRWDDNGAYTFTDVGVLIGNWTADGTDVEWDLGDTLHLAPTQSTRGAMEPAIVELTEPGRFLMSIRGSNYTKEHLPGYRWKAVSDDFGRTWSDITPMTYSDGTPFFSPSTMSDMRRSSVTGKIFWFGNISPENPSGNFPRFPLVVAEVDPVALGLIEDTVHVIADRDPNTDSLEAQFSNFSIIENPITGIFTLSLPFIDRGNRPDPIVQGERRFYQIDANGIPIVVPEPASALLLIGSAFGLCMRRRTH